MHVLRARAETLANFRCARAETLANFRCARDESSLRFGDCNPLRALVQSPHCSLRRTGAEGARFESARWNNTGSLAHWDARSSVQLELLELGEPSPASLSPAKLPLALE